MVIRATAKLLKLSGIKPIKLEQEAIATLPGEWYGGLLSLGKPGKMAVHFLHYPAKISVLVPGRSLSKTLPLLPDRAAELLARNGFSELVPQFNLQATPQVFTTNSRSMLAFMNQLAYALDYEFARAATPEAIDFAGLEDKQLDWLFTRNGKAGSYETPRQLLSAFSNS